jgi:hypothetical protein
MYVFINPLTSGIILVYVNDILIITRTKNEIAALKKLIFAKFKYYNIEPISYYLGI